MTRLLAAFLLLVSFCCSPATKPQEPPKPAEDPTTEWQPPRDDRPRYATPPPGSDSAPPRQTNKAPANEAREQPPATATQDFDESRGRSDGEAARKTADKAGMGSTVRPQPQPEERPGLGTHWGEARYSHVDEVPFQRASSSPTFSATLWYNDRQGSHAMAHGDSRGYVGYQRAASLALGRAVTMTLRNEYGSPLEAVYANGRTSAIGEAGQRYAITLQNNSPDRFEVVLSVDGLDVLDGRPASTQKRGYLLEPYASIEVDGFRQSDDYVAAFRFGNVRDSYAAQTGNGRNVGVIGCAVFAERGYYSYREIERRRQADPFPYKYAPPPPPQYIVQ